MYVVLGANGRAGGETALALIERGEAVRVVVRRAEQGDRWAKRGAQVAVADIDDVAGMAAAMKGASGAFLLNPPPTSGDPYRRSEEVGAALAEAVRRAGLPKAVFLSSVGAQHRSGTGVISTLNRVEALLEGAAPAIAFLRSGYFVETWSEVAAAVIAEGILPTFIEPAQQVPMVGTVDVGRAAADLLCEDWSGKRIVELGGPRDWSPDDVAAAFAEVLGRPVRPVFVPPEERAAVFAREGVPEEVAKALMGMYEGIASGKVVRETGTPHRRGTVPLIDAVARIVKEAERAAIPA